MYSECFRPENYTPARAIGEALEAINAVARAFGAPGDFGYETRKGQALSWLYGAAHPLHEALKALDRAELERRAEKIKAAEEQPRLPSALKGVEP